MLDTCTALSNSFIIFLFVCFTFHSAAVNYKVILHIKAIAFVINKLVILLSSILYVSLREALGTLGTRLLTTGEAEVDGSRLEVRPKLKKGGNSNGWLRFGDAEGERE